MKRENKINIWRILVILIGFSIALSGYVKAENYEYPDSWGPNGIKLEKETTSEVILSFSIKDFSIVEQNINGEQMHTIQFPGSFLTTNEGAPSLPNIGRYIAVPQGASVVISIIESREEMFSDLNVCPTPIIPLVTDEPPLIYEKDLSIYNQDAYFPADPVVVSSLKKVRGVDAVIVGITPFQYNPVTGNMMVIRDIKIKISFSGGNGQFGDTRYRSRTWDPILRDMFVNSASLPEINYNTNNTRSRNQDFEYVIITPDNPNFIFWADSLKSWRAMQGITTGVFTISEVGGNTTSAIEAFINNAYNNWNIPPSAVLLMADYGSGDDRITSPMWNNYCVSDNIYADVDGDDLPEMAFGRITAQNETHLEIMIGKMIDYEQLPPNDFNFYNNPISAGGWQSDRWFILCADICFGFWETALFKDPVREYAGYGGGAPGSWSTNQNTQMIIDYFGPNGLGYIPATPSHLTDWGANATRINADLNDGAFMIMHRDHGETNGWSDPSYHNNDLSGLDNNPLSYVFSINCLTGKYNQSGECFAEAFHRYDDRALGIMAASEVSYSFVNDTYVWGMFDAMWPNFDPGYGDPPGDSDWIRPAFANASGKHYLEVSNWPSNPQHKVYTHHLFHHHGDAYMTVYSELPEALTVSHNDMLPPSAPSIVVTADDGSLIGISENGQYLGSADGTGYPVSILIPAQSVGDILKVTVTKQNHYRYAGIVTVAGEPSNASNPVPVDNEDGTDPFTSFHWNKGNGGFPDYYKVFIGTDNPPTNIVNGEEVTDTLIILNEDLNFETEYFWRIESYNGYGTTDGVIWKFTTSSPPDEYFETGDFSANNWYFGGDAEWGIDNSESRCGEFSARSGEIEVGQSSSLFVEIETSSLFYVPIHFWVKVSTMLFENNLKLFIDGEQVGQWSGDKEWTKASFVVGNGLHTYEWRYEKTGPSGADQDCAWIDYINFPPQPQTILVNAGSDGTTCYNEGLTLDGSAENYTDVEWITSGDGTFDDNKILNPIYTPGDYDIVEGSATLTLTAYNTPTNSNSDDMLLTIIPGPDVPISPTGPDVVDVFYSNTTDYLTEGVGNADSYIWELLPDEAGTISGTGTTGTIDWDIYYLGLAEVRVKGVNDCGEGEFSESFEVTIINTVGIPKTNHSNLSVTITPNPNNGLFQLEIKTDVEDRFSFRILNSFGTVVYEENNLLVNKLLMKDIEIMDINSGVYFLYLESTNQQSVQKILIRK